MCTVYNVSGRKRSQAHLQGKKIIPREKKTLQMMNLPQWDQQCLASPYPDHYPQSSPWPGNTTETVINAK